MSPQNYGLTVICLGVIALLTVIFKRQVNKGEAAAIHRISPKRIDFR
jgi:hypothetical protein